MMLARTESKHFVPMLARIRRNVVSSSYSSSGAEDVPVAKPPATEVRKKQKIPSKVRTDIWATYIGAHIAEHKCICCKKVTIKQTDFEVGHVLSEAHGGTPEINNLRPICSVCNKSMGSRNMIEYVKQYGYYI